jgi:hypothetical protein
MISRRLPLCLMRQLSVAILLLSIGMYAQTREAAAYRARMDQAQDIKDNLRDAIDRRNSAKAVRLSNQLKVLLKQDEQYWEGRQLDDAISLGKASVALSSEISASARQRDFDGTLASYNRLQRVCSSCHDAHPEKRIVAK